MSNWIPVTERLPEENREVIMTIFDGGDHYVEAGRYAVSYSYVIVNGKKLALYDPVNAYDFTGPGFYICIDDAYKLIDDGFGAVIAWMPMPEPYRKEA